MTTPADSLTAVARSPLDTALKVAAIAAAGAERIADIQLRVLRTGFDSGLSQLQALSALRSPADLPGFATALSQPAAETLGACARDLTAALQTTRTELTRAVEAQVAGLGATTSAMVESALAHAPAGSGSAAATLRQMLDYGQNTCVTAIKSFTGLVEAAESQVAGLAPSQRSRKKAA